MTMRRPPPLKRPLLHGNRLGVWNRGDGEYIIIIHIPSEIATTCIFHWQKCVYWIALITEKGYFNWYFMIIMYMYVRHVITWRKPITACAEIAHFLAICEENAFFLLSKHGQNSAWPWSCRVHIYTPLQLRWCSIRINNSLRHYWLISVLMQVSHSLISSFSGCHLKMAGFWLFVNITGNQTVRIQNGKIMTTVISFLKKKMYSHKWAWSIFSLSCASRWHHNESCSCRDLCHDQQLGHTITNSRINTAMSFQSTCAAHGMRCKGDYSH